MFFEPTRAPDDKSASSFRPPAANDLLDPEVLKAFERVKSDDGSDILIELIDLYLDNSPQRIKEIRNAAANKESLLLKRSAHTLKGSSSTLGLGRMTRVCEQLENPSTNPDNVEDDPVECLELEFAAARQALMAERKRRVETPAKLR